MNLGELRALTRKLSGIHMATILSDAEANAAVNQAYLWLAGLAPWTFLLDDAEVASQADVGVYSYPSGIDTPRSIAISAPDSARRTLLYRRPEEFDRYPPHRLAESPWGWAVETDTMFRVFPTPTDGSLSFLVRGTVIPAELSGDSAEPVLPVEYHEAVAFEAAQRLLTEEGDGSGRAADYRRQVLASLLSMGGRFLIDDPEGAARVYAGALTEEEGE